MTNQTDDEAAQVISIFHLGYIIALLLIFAVALLKFLTLENLIGTQEDYAKVINVSGRQRMLSQRAAFFAVAYKSAQTENERVRFSGKLEDTINEFEESHKDLIEGDPDRGLPKLVHENILDVYYEQRHNLDQHVKEYVSAVREVLSSENAEEALTLISSLGPNGLLEKLNLVVQLHEERARKDVAAIQQIQFIFLCSTVVLLILEALFLFRPMIARIKAQIQNLRQNESVMEQQLEELQRFTTIAAHDLQEPLRRVTNFTERLADHIKGDPGKDVKQSMEFILIATAQMHELVNSLHSYSRIVSKDLELASVDCNKIIEAVKKDLDEQIKENNVEVVSSKLPTIQYEKAMLKQVFEQLVANAIKYKSANKKPEIEISVGEETNRWVFCVADNGLGIEEKFYERIFSMFQRLHRKEDIDGAGMGLALVKKIVEKHKGNIWVESELGKGSRFYFSVPKS